MILSDVLKAIAKKLVLIITVSIVITAVAAVGVLSVGSRVHSSKSVMKLEGTYIKNDGEDPFKVNTSYIISQLSNIVFECTTKTFHTLVLKELNEIDTQKYRNLRETDIAKAFTVAAQKDTTFLLIETNSNNANYSLDLCVAVNEALLSMNGDGIDDIGYDNGLMEFQSIDDAYYVGYSTGSAYIKLAIILIVAIFVGVILELIYSFTIPFANNRLVTETMVKSNVITVVNKQNWIDDIKEILGIKSVAK